MLLRPRANAQRRALRVAADAPGHRRAGQSLVEFALVFPILLLLLLAGLDLGRVFLGWVSLNNTSRVAANYAASNALLVDAGNPAAMSAYNDVVQNDAKTTNCEVPDPAPNPVFSPNAQIGGQARVSLSCNFEIVTPIVSQILGGSVTVSASAIFPVRVGIVANVPGGAGSGPVAAFTPSPTSGDAPLTVAVTNMTTGPVATWSWDFGNGQTSVAENPGPVTYLSDGTYTITLTASDGINSSTATRTISVTLPPGPIAAFTATPSSGTEPLGVSFADASSGSNLTYAWDFGNGDTSTDPAPPSVTYAAGTWVISLVVTDDGGLTSTATQTVTVAPVIATCTVPNFKNDTTSDTTITKWTAAGFVAGNILFSPSRPPEYKISKQSLAAGLVLPCATTTITVYDH